jgi:hypothetical protein
MESRQGITPRLIRARRAGAAPGCAGLGRRRVMDSPENRGFDVQTYDNMEKGIYAAYTHCGNIKVPPNFKSDFTARVFARVSFFFFGSCAVFPSIHGTRKDCS